MSRWAMKELESMNDIDFAICILNERNNQLTQQYSPLSQKLKRAVRTLEQISEQNRNKGE